MNTIAHRILDDVAVDATNTFLEAKNHADGEAS